MERTPGAGRQENFCGGRCFGKGYQLPGSVAPFAVITFPQAFVLSVQGCHTHEHK